MRSYVTNFPNDPVLKNIQSLATPAEGQQRYLSQANVCIFFQTYQHIMFISHICEQVSQFWNLSAIRVKLSCSIAEQGNNGVVGCPCTLI